MSIYSKIKDRLADIGKLLFIDDVHTPPPAPGTGSDLLTFPDITTVELQESYDQNLLQYKHVSVPLLVVDNPLLRKMLRRNYADAGKGTHLTDRRGINEMKRAADSAGANNKQRRRLRAKFKVRLNELVTA